MSIIYEEMIDNINQEVVVSEEEEIMSIHTEEPEPELKIKKKKRKKKRKKKKLKEFVYENYEKY
tara:strand:- start:172 stop:363 length:192 start_codon:yes stop_codon:yes gene_type:complete